MTTYDGAYTNKKGAIYKGGWNDICVCDDNKVNDFCSVHGKYKDGYFKEAKDNSE